MLRTFHLQFYSKAIAREPQTAADREAERTLLDRVAKSVDRLLGYPDQEYASIRSDSANFHCYVGAPDSKVLLVVKRGCSASQWTPEEELSFAKLLAVAYHERGYKSPRDPTQDGNLPRPAEET